MTPGGEIMLRIRDMCVVSMATQRVWNTARAKSLARMMAWHRRSRGLAGESMVRRIILEDIIPDIGWPRMAWLKPRVRQFAAEIAGSLADAGRDAQADARPEDGDNLAPLANGPVPQSGMRPDLTGYRSDGTRYDA